MGQMTQEQWTRLEEMNGEVILKEPADPEYDGVQDYFFTSIDWNLHAGSPVCGVRIRITPLGHEVSREIGGDPKDARL